MFAPASVAGMERIKHRKGFYESQSKVTLTCVYISRVRIRFVGAGSSEACDDVRRLDGHAEGERAADFARWACGRLHGGDDGNGRESHCAQYLDGFYHARKPAASTDAGRTRHPASVVAGREENRVSLQPRWCNAGLRDGRAGGKRKENHFAVNRS